VTLPELEQRVEEAKLVLFAALDQVPISVATKEATIGAVVTAVEALATARAIRLPDNPALSALSTAKLRYPQLRVGQIIVNAVQPQSDIYYLPDETLSALILRAAKEAAK
jgi:hypothetical protein